MTVMAIGSGEGQQRCEHQKDNRLTIDSRLDHLLRGKPRFRQPFAKCQEPALMLLSGRKTCHTILDDNHGPIDDQTEVQRAQTHQIA